MKVVILKFEYDMAIFRAVDVNEPDDLAKICGFCGNSVFLIPCFDNNLMRKEIVEIVKMHGEFCESAIENLCLLYKTNKAFIRR